MRYRRGGPFLHEEKNGQIRKNGGPCEGKKIGARTGARQRAGRALCSTGTIGDTGFRILTKLIPYRVGSRSRYVQRVHQSYGGLVSQCIVTDGQDNDDILQIGIGETGIQKSQLLGFGAI